MSSSAARPMDALEGPLPTLKGYHMPRPMINYTTTSRSNSNSTSNGTLNGCIPVPGGGGNHCSHASGSGAGPLTDGSICASTRGLPPQPRLKPKSFQHSRSVTHGTARMVPMTPLGVSSPCSPLPSSHGISDSYANPRSRLEPHSHTVTYVSRRTAAAAAVTSDTNEAAVPGALGHATHAHMANSKLPCLLPPSFNCAETQGSTVYREFDGSNSPLTFSLPPRTGSSNKCSSSAPEGFEASPQLSPTLIHNLTLYEESEIKGYFPEVYFTGLQRDKKPLGSKELPQNYGYDDENDHYIIHDGDHIAYRYEIAKELGRGTFGVVVQAQDHKTKKPVAIKIVKNRPAYTKQAKEEASFLQTLLRDDLADTHNIVHLVETFMFRKHYILVFELLEKDVYRFIQGNKYRPMDLDYVYDFSEQVLSALQFIAAHKIIHCDIKPENIVMDGRHRSHYSDHPRIKIIDFGSSCCEDKRVFTYIQSRYYRAPEIILGIPYTTAIDMWSFGCVLCELLNGYPIFPASSEGELLERMTEYLGNVPEYLVRQGKRSSKFFIMPKCVMLPNLSHKGRKCHGPHARRLQHFLKAAYVEKDDLCIDFVAKCLQYDPARRMTAAEALQHPWLVRNRAAAKRH